MLEEVREPEQQRGGPEDGQHVAVGFAVLVMLLMASSYRRAMRLLAAESGLALEMLLTVTAGGLLGPGDVHSLLDERAAHEDHC